jgi:hypothetical protein
MRRRMLFAAATVLAGVGVALGAIAAAAQAQAVGADSAAGDVTTDPSRPESFVFAAHSGPSGENPSGSAFWIDRSLTFGGPVTCLTVTGNRATIGFENHKDFAQDFKGGFVFVEDGGSPGPGQDGARPSITRDAPTVCPPNREIFNEFNTVTTGDLIVTDAPPATYAECRQAGWVKYGYASHAQCIGAVHDFARQKCIFERVAHGIAAFRTKYGFAPDQSHAMRHCVRLYTGF